jgi:hypothetical protein
MVTVSDALLLLLIVFGVAVVKVDHVCCCCCCCLLLLLSVRVFSTGGRKALLLCAGLNCLC